MLIAPLHDADKSGDRSGVVADAVAQVFADGRLTAGFIIRVHDLVPRTGQQGIEVFPGPVGFLGPEYEVNTGQLVDEFATPALGHAAQESEDFLVPALPIRTDDILHPAQGLLFGHVADAASVEQDDVGLALGGGQE